MGQICRSCQNQREADTEVGAQCGRHGMQAAEEVVGGGGENI